MKKTLTYALGIMVAVVAFAAAHPAYAEDRDGHKPAGYHEERFEHERRAYEEQRHPNWERHEREAEQWHHRHVVPAPAVVYAPPAVVMAPIVPSSLNLIIPLDIR